MTRVDDYLELVDNPARQALTPGHPADDALLALLVHVAFSDGEVDPGELAFLQKVLPGRDSGQLEDWVKAVGSVPLELRAVAAALPHPDERWKAVRFAARMAWKDGQVQDEEAALLRRLAEALELPPGTVRQVLGELSGRAGAQVEPDRVIQAIADTPWNSVQIIDEPIGGAIAQVVPGSPRPVRSIALDDVVVAAIHTQGFAAHFLEGTAFIAWPDLVTYTRVPTFGAAVQLHTEDGRTWSLVDSRLRGVAVLFDRLFAGTPRERSEPPVVTQLKGEHEG